ncbi:MAG TPA: DEAD/DEAH box helicase [Longimicrobiales bacterium]|nr:DEAD/DEAH box helicase [Longimicrobiales bacterium]
MTFDELTSSPGLLRAVADLGWTSPTPIQAKGIPPVREGRDVVGIAQTGTGKTGAFLIPTLERQSGREGLHTLVLCPTRELAQQVAEDARALSAHLELFVGEIYGGVPYEPQLRDLRAGFDVLVATPGRLIDHMDRGNINLSEVDALILDEADRMLDMGFRPQLERLLEQIPTKRQTLLFSATMPNGVHALALRILNDPVWVEASPQSTAAETVEQRVYSVRPDRKVDLLMHLLEEQDMDQVLVFTRTKRGADLLYHRLRGAGIGVNVIHGDRNMKQRGSAMEAFAEGQVQVLVATDVAQRGLDIEGISHVINYDVPHDPEDYVHRIGRTGRAGSSGDAITFMTAAELALVQSIERVLGYGLPRISLEGFDYAGTSAAERPKPGNRSNRAGRRLGARSTKDLTPEELERLLNPG